MDDKTFPDIPSKYSVLLVILEKFIIIRDRNIRFKSIYIDKNRRLKKNVSIFIFMSKFSIYI